MRYQEYGICRTWWRHQMEAFSALLALCERNAPVTGGFPSQRPVTWSFDAFFDLRLEKQLSKQSRRRWFETPSHSLWRHCNDKLIFVCHHQWGRISHAPAFSVSRNDRNCKYIFMSSQNNSIQERIRLDVWSLLLEVGVFSRRNISLHIRRTLSNPSKIYLLKNRNNYTSLERVRFI